MRTDHHDTFRSEQLQAARLDPAAPALEPIIASYLTFSTRETYLGWVVAWKAAYRQVSAEIRAAKAFLRHRSGTDADFWPTHVALGRLRCLAWNLLVLRAAGKRRAAALSVARAGSRAAAAD